MPSRDEKVYLILVKCIIGFCLYPEMQKMDSKKKKSRGVLCVHEGARGHAATNMLHISDEHKLELLIGGMVEVLDMDDWMRFADYCEYEKTDQVIE